MLDDGSAWKGSWVSGRLVGDLQPLANRYGGSGEVFTDLLLLLPTVQSEYTQDIPGFSLRDESTLVTLAEEALEVSNSKSGNLPVRNLRNGKRSQSNSRFQT